MDKAESDGRMIFLVCARACVGARVWIEGVDGAAHTVGGLLLVGGSTAAVGALVVTSQPQKLSLSLKLESCLLDDRTKVMTDTQRMRYMAGVFATFHKMVSEAKGFLATCVALIVSVPPLANISRDHRSFLYWNSVLF